MQSYYPSLLLFIIYYSIRIIHPIYLYLFWYGDYQIQFVFSVKFRECLKVVYLILIWHKRTETYKTTGLRKRFFFVPLTSLKWPFTISKNWRVLLWPIDFIIGTSFHLPEMSLSVLPRGYFFLNGTTSRIKKCFFSFLLFH